MRAAALNLVTAAIILFNCRYLDRAVSELGSRGVKIDPALLSQLSPLGWDRINLTGDYVPIMHRGPFALSGACTGICNIFSGAFNRDM